MNYCCRLLSVAATAIASLLCSPALATDGLTLSWKTLPTGDPLRPHTVLVVHGDRLSGDLEILYLEAYCRADSTAADWSRQTVLPHRTELVSIRADQRQIQLRDVLDDGVVVHHTVTAGVDEIDFRLVAHNPTSRRSAAHWAQPCVRVGRFTGTGAQDTTDDYAYVSHSFLFVDGQLARMPITPWATDARYTPGQVWCPAHIPRSDVNPRPLSAVVPDNGLISCFSADRKSILAIAWEPYQELFQGVIRCLHSDFRLGGLDAGQTLRIRGKLYVVPNDVSRLLTRYECDFPEQVVAPTVGHIETVAGTGRPADVGQPFGVELGPDGGLYTCDVENHRVWRSDLTTGALRVVAGSGQKGYRGNGGPATAARLNEPYEVRFDAAGNMFIVEMQNHLVRRVDATTGNITTVAGTGRAGFGGDGGPATEAQLSSPHSIALDSRGFLYIADIGNHRIRRVNLDRGTIRTIAGTGARTLPRPGQIAQGNPLLGPRALCIDGRTLWIALRQGHSIWKMDLDRGLLWHVAGTGQSGYGGDGGPALLATFNGPKGIAVGPTGDVDVVDTENQAIRRIHVRQGTITTIAGRGPRARGYEGDGGPATRAALDRPHGICLGPAGEVYLGDTNNHRVRRVEFYGPPEVTVVVGQLLPSEGGPAAATSPLHRPFGVDFDRDGNMMIAELEGGRVHRLTAAGSLATIAGDGSQGYTGDTGPAARATFDGMHNVAVTVAGDIYIADSWNHCVRKIEKASGTITTIAGTGQAGFAGDGGLATAAMFNFVMCITLNAAEDTLYVADLKNLRIRAVNLLSGTVETIAGNGKRGVPQDGAPALHAPLVDPRAVTVDSRGQVYILERGGHALRVVLPDGTIQTVAGTGEKGYRDGPPLQARFGAPKHICVDAEDNVYIADDVNRAIRKYDPVAHTVSTVLGRGRGNPAVELSHPHGVCFEQGKLVVVDTGNNRILRLE
jgi:sugar lactone lactonase YvrE